VDLGDSKILLTALILRIWYTFNEVIEISNNTTYNIRIDSRIKKEADALYKSMGMSLSSAVNLFLTQSVIQRRLPIDAVIAEPLGEPPSDDDYNSFETWEQAKEWLNA
jgi:DNA-damage-inducible protein J